MVPPPLPFLAPEREGKAAEPVAPGGDAGKAKALARAVKDAEVTLGQVRRHQDTLARELAQRHATHKPAGGEPDNVVSAAIWPKLPATALEMKVAYRGAIARADWLTANAIESLPGVYGGRLSPEDLIDLRRERICAAGPVHYAALVMGEDALEAVEGVASTVARHLLEVGAGLPEPDPETGGTVGDDGLLILSPSQADEALANA